MCLQNLDTQKSTLFKDIRSNLAMSCPLPGLSISMKEKPSSISWKLWHSSRQVPDFNWKELKFSREGIWPEIWHIQNFHRVHALLAQATPATSHRLGRNSSGAVANPAAGVQAGKHGSMGAALPLLLLPHMAGKGKTPKINKDAWHFP